MSEVDFALYFLGGNRETHDKLTLRWISLSNRKLKAGTKQDSLANFQKIGQLCFGKD